MYMHLSYVAATFWIMYMMKAAGIRNNPAAKTPKKASVGRLYAAARKTMAATTTNRYFIWFSNVRVSIFISP